MSRVGVMVMFLEKPGQTVECLESFLPSGAPIYVLNNGSSDRSARIVKRFAAANPRVTVWDSPRNLGPAAGRNVLISRTAEEWLFFCDNDARVETEEWRDVLEGQIASHPGVEAFMPLVRHAHAPKDTRWGRFAIREGRLVEERGEGPETNVVAGTGIIRRSLFERIGVFDEALWAFEDLELGVRCLAAGRPLRSRHLDDIRLLHDHRSAATPEDRRAVAERYDEERIQRAFDHLLRKHALAFDHRWRPWADRERRRMLEPRWKRWWSALASGYLRRASARR